MSLQAILLNLAGAIAIALVTWWVTAKLLRRQVRIERRVDAYRRVIDTLRAIERTLSHRSELERLPPAAAHAFAHALGEIQALIDREGWLLSPNAMAILEGIGNDLGLADRDQALRFEPLHGVIAKRLADFLDVARKEFGVLRFNGGGGDRPGDRTRPGPN